MTRGLVADTSPSLQAKTDLRPGSSTRRMREPRKSVHVGKREREKVGRPPPQRFSRGRWWAAWKDFKRVGVNFLLDEDDFC